MIKINKKNLTKKILINMSKKIKTIFNRNSSFFWQIHSKIIYSRGINEYQNFSRLLKEKKITKPAIEKP